MPLFDGTKYALGSIWTKLILQSQGLDVWLAVENGYIVPDTTPVAGTNERKLMECNGM